MLQFLQCTKDNTLTILATCGPGLEHSSSEEVEEKLHNLRTRNDFTIFIYHIHPKFEYEDLSLYNKEIIRIFERKDIKSMLQGKIVIQLHFSSTIEDLKQLLFEEAISSLLQCLSIVKIHILVYILENLEFPLQEKNEENGDDEDKNIRKHKENGDGEEKEWTRRLKNDSNFNYFLDCHHQVMPSSNCWKESLLKWMNMRNLLFKGSNRPKLTNLESLKFRITSRRSGKHNFKSSDILSWFGLLISHELMGDEICDIGKTWKADLTNYDLDIFAHLYNNTLFLSFTLCEETICLETFSKQFNNSIILNSTSLRPNIAYGLIKLANIQKSDIFCDICCGTGIISLMALHLFKDSIQIISGEYSGEIINYYLTNNISHYKYPTNAIHPIQWDFTRLPLKTSSIDVICSNLPFGKQIGSHSLNREIYPSMFRELCRALKENGRAVLLTSEKHLMQKALQENKVFISLQQRLTIHQGGSDVFVYILTRKNKPWFVKKW